MNYTVSIQCNNYIPKLYINATTTGTETITKVSVYSQSTWDDNPVWSKEYSNVSSIAEELISQQLDGACLNKDLIIVKIDAVDSSSTERNPSYIAIVYNKRIEILKTLSYCKELCDCCKFPEGLLNSMLQVKALDYAIQSGDIAKAITYWNKWYKGEWNCNQSNNTGGCGCE